MIKNGSCRMNQNRSADFQCLSPSGDLSTAHGVRMMKNLDRRRKRFRPPPKRGCAGWVLLEVVQRRDTVYSPSMEERGRGHSEREEGEEVVGSEAANRCFVGENSNPLIT